MSADQINKKKMDAVMKIIRQQLSQGKKPKEVEDHLVEQGLPQQTAITLIKKNLKPVSAAQPQTPAAPSDPQAQAAASPQPETGKSIFEGMSRRQKDKAMATYILEKASQGFDQAMIVDGLVENGIERNMAIDWVIKVIGVEIQDPTE